MNTEIKKMKRELYNLYAGHGKTYYIINNLIPTLDDYLVISNQHKTLLEYRQKGLNSKVIIDWNVDEIPLCKNWIIDEYAQLAMDLFVSIIEIADANDVNLYLFGDDRQLGAVDGKKLKFSKSFLKSYFTHVDDGKGWINRRNTFTISYYDEILHSLSFGKNEIISKSTDWKTDENVLIIAYRNKTLDKYEEEWLKHFNKNRYDIDNKFYCSNGKGLQLAMKNKGLYGDMEVKLTRIEEDGVYIYNKEIGEIDITHKQFDTYFKLSCCSTAHRVQCKTIPAYYWCIEDNDYLTPEMCYVVVSRLSKDNLLKC